MSAKKNPTTPKTTTTKKAKAPKVAIPTAPDAVVAESQAPATLAPANDANEAKAAQLTATKNPKAKAGKTAKPEKSKKMSALDAAAKVLADAGQPMNCSDMIEAMTKKGLWSSPNGLTPAATLYAAILRETKVKGDAARFVKTERGKFAAKA